MFIFYSLCAIKTGGPKFEPLFDDVQDDGDDDWNEFNDVSECGWSLYSFETPFRTNTCCCHILSLFHTHKQLTGK
jgi:hypothetical protein